jgi:pimeloyl-[acyl-carrier protein] methyl ester esterase
MSISIDISGQGRPLVLLHGWGSARQQHMQPIVDLLKTEYEIHNVSLPGCNHSPWNDEIDSIESMAHSIMNQLPSKAIYIGWSFGGLLSIAIATINSERVKRIIGIGSTPCFIAKDNWPGGRASGFTDTFKKNITDMGLKKFFAVSLAPEFESVDQPENHRHLLTLIKNSTFNEEILLKGIAILEKTDLREELKSLSCPVDFILGSEDDCVPSDQLPHLQALNPSIKLHIINNARHFPFWTHPHEFNAILKNILNP